MLRRSFALIIVLTVKDTILEIFKDLVVHVHKMKITIQKLFFVFNLLFLLWLWYLAPGENYRTIHPSGFELTPWPNTCMNHSPCFAFLMGFIMAFYYAFTWLVSLSFLSIGLIKEHFEKPYLRQFLLWRECKKNLLTIYENWTLIFKPSF